MIVLLNVIVIGLISVTASAQFSKCRPSVEFYHIPHGAISAWIDQPVLDGFYISAYTIRSHIARFNGKQAVALTTNSENIYLIQSECYGASPKGGASVTLIDAKTNSSQVVTYPMGYHEKPITFISPRGEQIIIECVDTALFAFNIMLKNSKQVVAQVRNIRIPKVNRMGITDIFTIEVNEYYRDIRSFLIAVTLVVDEYIYPASIQQKRKACKSDSNKN